MNIVPLSRAGGGKQKIAVIGSGISGASAAWALSKTDEVTLYEAEGRPGGHTATVDIDYDGTAVSVDTGFIVYNEHNYPEFTALLAHLGIAAHDSDMGFSLSLDGGRLEWSCSNLRLQKRYPSGLFVLFEATHITKMVEIPSHVNLRGDPFLFDNVAVLAKVSDDVPF